MHLDPDEHLLLLLLRRLCPARAPAPPICVRHCAGRARQRRCDRELDVEDAVPALEVAQRGAARCAAGRTELELARVDEEELCTFRKVGDSIVGGPARERSGGDQARAPPRPRRRRGQRLQEGTESTVSSSSRLRPGRRRAREHVVRTSESASCSTPGSGQHGRWVQQGAFFIVNQPTAHGLGTKGERASEGRGR